MTPKKCSRNFVNKHGISEWGLLALYRHKEILVNSSLKEEKKNGKGNLKSSGERSRAILALLFNMGLAKEKKEKENMKHCMKTLTMLLEEVFIYIHLFLQYSVPTYKLLLNLILIQNS